jgi:hypothetical protein
MRTMRLKHTKLKRERGKKKTTTTTIWNPYNYVMSINQETQVQGETVIM